MWRNSQPFLGLPPQVERSLRIRLLSTRPRDDFVTTAPRLRHISVTAVYSSDATSHVQNSCEKRRPNNFQVGASWTDLGPRFREDERKMGSRRSLPAPAAQ